MSLHYDKLKYELGSASNYISQAVSELRNGTTLRGELLEEGESKIRSFIEYCEGLREDTKKLKVELEQLKNKAHESERNK